LSENEYNIGYTNRVMNEADVTPIYFSLIANFATDERYACLA